MCAGAAAKQIRSLGQLDLRSLCHLGEQLHDETNVFGGEAGQFELLLRPDQYLLQCSLELLLDGLVLD